MLGKSDQDPVEWIRENADALNFGEPFTKKLDEYSSAESLIEKDLGIFPLLNEQVLQKAVMDEFIAHNERQVES